MGVKKDHADFGCLNLSMILGMRGMMVWMRLAHVRCFLRVVLGTGGPF
jgi:hypothetical protein